MAHRLNPPADPVEIEHDGTRLVAERGEPLAMSLIAADRLLLARSPKLHRPRGPFCLRGACDGCLARVDGVPNVMTCRTAARGGVRVETQNVLGSRGVDVLRAADFMFPSGIDHHRLLAGVRGVSGVVQKFARRVAGLGKLPSAAADARPANRRELDALVIGGGAAGLSAAAGLGARALLADDALAPGGSHAALDPRGARDLVERARAARAHIESATSALALYREPEDERGRLHALLEGPAGATLVVARAVVLAGGAHDALPAFDNNDLPGVVSARAALRLWRAGIAVGRRVIVAGGGRFAEAFVEQTRDALSVTRVALDDLVRAIGRARVGGAWVRDGERERRLVADALVVDAPGAPSFELGVQAGANVRFDAARGFALVTDATRAAAPGVWCAGSCRAGNADSALDGTDAARAALAALTGDS
jgi:2Fe-2S iron-sulfur cluster binding domain